MKAVETLEIAGEAVQVIGRFIPRHAVWFTAMFNGKTLTPTADGNEYFSPQASANRRNAFSIIHTFDGVSISIALASRKLTAKE
ncbi:hypothetical protein [Neorhizobium sp. DT-125]|uniref:hypothetical protein n=1 Tax=Neorhizobium sp. DT-125 TaxID=3396163 RepID=UPI003F197757